MKVTEKTHVQPQIDEDTGLPIDVLRAEILKGVNSPTVEFSMESIRAKGREKLKKLQANSK